MLGLLAPLLVWRLGSLLPGINHNEAATLQLAHQNLHYFLTHPGHAPYLLLVKLALLLPVRGIVAARVVAVFFGVLTLAAVYWLIRYWQGRRAALFSTLLFGSSAWFLHAARLGSPDVLLCGAVWLVGIGVWLKHTNWPGVAILLLAAAAILMYEPGMVWIIAAGLVWQWRTLDKAFKKYPSAVIGGGLAFVVLLAPLGWGLYKQGELWRTLLLLPAHGWPQPLAVVKAAAWAPLHLFVRGPQLPGEWLGHVPLLSTLVSALIFLGGYAHLKHFALRRSWVLLALIVVAMGLVGLGGAPYLSVALPFMYVVAAAGVALLLDRWQQVFPRNKIAKTVGLGLVSIAVGASCYFGIRAYFVAWPHAPETRGAYSSAAKLAR